MNKKILIMAILAASVSLCAGCTDDNHIIKDDTIAPITTEAPAATSDTLEATEVPATEKLPEETTVSPVEETTGIPEETTVPPEETTEAPKVTTALPSTTVAPPEESDIPPEVIVPSVPETTVPIPETTVPAPETTAPVPETTAPPADTTAPNEFKELTYEEYNALSGDEQFAYFNQFKSTEEFFLWYNKAKQEYEDKANSDDIIIDGEGNVNLGDIIG